MDTQEPNDESIDLARAFESTQDDDDPISPTHSALLAGIEAYANETDEAFASLQKDEELHTAFDGGATDGNGMFPDDSLDLYGSMDGAAEGLNIEDLFLDFDSGFNEDNDQQNTG